MNILIISHYNDSEGPGKIYVHEQAKAYKKLGHDVIEMTPVTLGKKYKHKYFNDAYDEIPFIYPKKISISSYGEFSINRWASYIVIKQVVKKIIKEFQPDIIHAHTILFDGYIATRIKKDFGIPCVITTHGTDTMSPIVKGNGNRLKEVCTGTDGCVTVSRKLSKMLLEHGIKSKTITNGFNCRGIHDITKRSCSIIQVSNLIKQKNLDITIKAFSKVVKKYEEANLTIIGMGPEKDNLFNLINELALNKNVTFIDSLSNEEVLDKMAESQVFIMPSVNEGLGIVYLEAMNEGCVTLGTKGEGIEDIIIDGENGFLFNPEDIDKISERICDVYEHYEKYTEIINKGTETVKHLTWENNASKYLELFDEILKGQ